MSRSVVLLLLLFVAWSASAPTGRPGDPIPGQFIVRFKDYCTEEMMQELEKDTNPIFKYRHAFKGFAARLGEAQLNRFRAHPDVDFVEQDGVVTVQTTQSGATWGIDRIDQRLLPLSTTYSYTSDGTGVTAYVLDTGILFSHTQFGSRATFGFDAFGGNGVDCNGHGTHVSGTIGGITYGVAKNVNLVAVRVLDCSGSGTYSGVVAGMDWVTANRVLPAVASMSLGGGYSSSLNAAVSRMVGAGVPVAVAAGNSNADACRYSPSSAPDAITVAATTSSDSGASYSNWGPCVDVAAPGSGITSAWIGSNSATNTISGTSMATPHVSGLVARYLQAHPSATPSDVTAYVTMTSSSTKFISYPAGRVGKVKPGAYPEPLVYIAET
eukprot:Colp12_sorted_trinity150504_noHs@10414